MNKLNNEIADIDNDDNNDDVIHAFGLPNNVICIKKLLSEKEQIDLIHLSHDLYPSNYLQMSPFPQHTPWIYYNWPTKFMEKDDVEIMIKNDKQKQKEMQLLLNLGSILGKMIISIAETARKQKEEKNDPLKQQIAKQQQEQKCDINQQNDRFSNDDKNVINNKNIIYNQQQNEKKYSPKAIYGILYPAKGFLEAHTDAHQGWIVSISIGATCDFWFYDQNDKDNKQKNNKQKNKKHHINIESGDIMIFPGYRLMHGVDTVQQNAPRFWKILQAKRVIPLQFVRYCLQYRHPLK